MPAVHSMTNAGKDFTKSSTAFICVKNGLSKSKGRARPSPPLKIMFA